MRAARTATNVPVLWLVPISGPSLTPIEIKPKPAGQVIGRHEQSDLRLPPDAEQVSRFHARITHNASGTRIADVGSRGGTFVNGVRLEPNHDAPLDVGDMIRLTPWMFVVSDNPDSRGQATIADSNASRVRSITLDATAVLEHSLLTLLLESASAIHACKDIDALAKCVIDAAVRGTGLPNAAILKAIDNKQNYQVITSRGRSSTSEGGYSQSLLEAASRGEPVEISGDQIPNVSESMVMMDISCAICVPIMLGDVPAAFLYLDARSSEMRRLKPSASAFCVALGRMASLALANIKRVDMEKREAQLQSEISAAAMAQRWILPRREFQFDQIRGIGESRPGRLLGGDFFDVIPLAGNRLAITLGDVSGKGITASVLMTASQGFLHSALTGGRPLADAIAALNHYVFPRRPTSRFVTIWGAILDLSNRTLTYVDAGHSYAFLKRADGKVIQLDEAGGLPIGIDESEPYKSATVDLKSGDALMVVSDGIIEQSALTRDARGDRQQFGVEGLIRFLSTIPDDPVKAIFDAVERHAGTTALGDDATAVWIR